MLSKEEMKIRNTQFWTEFRDYMKKERSSNGRKMNWAAYPSDVKDIYIRLQVDGHGARLCMDLQMKDAGVRAIIWEQLLELKKVLEIEMTIETQWIESYTMPDGSIISRIMWEDNTLNFYHEEDKQLIFKFLSLRITEFDRFYQEFKEILINLMD